MISLIGLVAFVVMTIDRLVNGTPGDPIVAGASVSLTLFPYLSPRAVDTIAQRFGTGPK